MSIELFQERKEYYKETYRAFYGYDFIEETEKELFMENKIYDEVRITYDEVWTKEINENFYGKCAAYRKISRGNDTYCLVFNDFIFSAVYTREISELNIYVREAETNGYVRRKLFTEEMDAARRFVDIIRQEKEFRLLDVTGALKVDYKF